MKFIFQYKQDLVLGNKQKFVVNVLKFWTLIACQEGLDKQHKPGRNSLNRQFPIYYSDKHFMNSSPSDNQQFVWEPKELSVQILRKFTIVG